MKKAHEIPLFQGKTRSIEEANQKKWGVIQTSARSFSTELSQSMAQVAERAKRIFDEGMNTLSQLDSNLIANIHTDLHPRNLFWADRKFLIIDWENSTQGHPYYDLASLSIFFGFDESQEKELLKGYFGGAPDDAQLSEYALLKKIRWAHTSFINAYVVMTKLAASPECDPIPAPHQSFGAYMQDFAETDARPPMEFSVNVARLALQMAEAE